MPHASWGPPGVSRDGLTRIDVPGIPLWVRSEVAPLYRELVRRLPEARGPGAPALSSSGGYIKRRIAGSATWSNHSWGLAADFNAPTNPHAAPMRTDFDPATARAIARELGMRWGGDYRRPDPMHFEFMGSRDDAAEIARRLQTRRNFTRAAIAAALVVATATRYPFAAPAAARALHH